MVSEYDGEVRAQTPLSLPQGSTLLPGLARLRPLAPHPPQPAACCTRNREDAPPLAADGAMALHTLQPIRSALPCRLLNPG